MSTHKIIVLLLAVAIVVSVTDAAPLKGDNSDLIIQGRVKGNYMDNIRNMCKRTKGLIRTTKEIAACHLYESIAGSGHALDVDKFILN